MRDTKLKQELLDVLDKLTEAQILANLINLEIFTQNYDFSYIDKHSRQVIQEAITCLDSLPALQDNPIAECVPAAKAELLKHI